MTKQYTLPKGTICKINGIPFELAEDTVINSNNWELMHELGRDDQRCSRTPKEVKTIQPTVKRIYQYPAATLQKVAELLGIEKEFAELQTLYFSLSAFEDYHKFPPILIIEAGGETHAFTRAKEEEIFAMNRAADQQEYKDLMATQGLDENGEPLPKAD